MKPSALATALKVCIEMQQPVCVWGEPGIGKSQITHQVSKSLGRNLLDIRAVLLDAVDVHGLPTVTPEGKVKWAVPVMWPTSGEGVIFLDELNRAPALVQNALFQLVLDRKIGTEYALPDGWTVVAACNPTGGGTTKMSDALSNRFVHLQAEANLEDWGKWAVTHDIEPVVIAFLRLRTELLHKFEPGQKAFPTPRSWEFVSRISAANPGRDIEHSLFEGAVGGGAATEYSSFLRLFRELPNIDVILAEPKKTKVPTEPATLYAVCSALARRAEAKNIANVVVYLNRLPQEYAVMCMKDAMQRLPMLASHEEFTKWTIKNQEVFA